MFVVGALAVAAVSMPDAASAAPRHFMRFSATHFSARAQRHGRVPLLRTSVRRQRPARGRRVAARFERTVLPVQPMYAPRAASAWRRLARRSRVAANYRPISATASPRSERVRRRIAARGRLAPVFRPVAAQLSAAAVGAALPVAAAPVAVAAAAAPARSGVQTGRASFYHGGGRTAAGGHVGAATCAHRWLPFGTKVLVTNLANARRAVLTVNDRGPFVGGRIVDVSTGAAGLLGMLHSGTAPVSVQVVGGRG